VKNHNIIKNNHQIIKNNGPRPASHGAPLASGPVPRWPEPRSAGRLLGWAVL
jgi:hypothetical protein